jgi:hypothetical protein
MKKKIIAAAVAIALAVTLAGCSGGTEAEEYENRKELSKQYDRDSSLELTNLQEKRKREDDPNAIRYLYLMNFGQIVGYYVTKGKVSSSGSQIAPETEIIRVPGVSGGYNQWSVESAKDDGSYGTGDPGIFFFTSDGVMVETSLDYIQSDAPLAIDVPRLYG